VSDSAKNMEIIG